MINAFVVTDSVSPLGDRLTTMVVDCHRFVLSEFNTHRKFCVAGDAMLEFDLPGGVSNNHDHRRVYRMRIDEFVDKWKNGARRSGKNPRKNLDKLKSVDTERVYTGREAASILGQANPSNIHKACRDGSLPSFKMGRVWNIKGSDLINWRKNEPGHSDFDITNRLKSMRIRQIDEDSGLIRTSTVNEVYESGTKSVYSVTVGLSNGKSESVATSLNHLFYTPNGYVKLSDLAVGDEVVVRRYGKFDHDKSDSMRLLKIGGKWRNQWQREIRSKLTNQQDGKCSNCCLSSSDLEIHHIIPVHVDQSLVFDESNVTLVCVECHDKEHSHQGWQEGMYLYGDTAVIESIDYRGEEMTYDLEIDGQFPNFVANGFIIHNSRNSASSRAIPLGRRISAVRESPAMPVHWGKNQAGMQADVEMSLDEARMAARVWRQAAENAAVSAEALLALGLHKQVAARILEPFLWHRIVVTATDWEGFFVQRCHSAAQPEMRVLAEKMREALEWSIPKPIGWTEWHLPFIDDDEREVLLVEEMKMVSVGRCAAVSYLRSDKRPADKEIELYHRLYEGMHASPFEHVARPAMIGQGGCANFTGWQQLRHIVKMDQRMLQTEMGEHEASQDA